MSEILLQYTRGGKVENIHRGDIIAVDAMGKIVDCVGDPKKKMFWRSAAKPFQALPFVQKGGLDAFGITQKELAILVSSHSGEPMHVELIEQILAKLKLTTGVLDCGPARPMNSRAAKALTENHQKPQPVHNACSGKHSGMLALGSMLNISLENYTKPEHEIQKIMHKSVAMAAKIAESDLEIGIDGCGVPVFYLPLYNMALAYARLAVPEKAQWGEYEDSVRKIGDAMSAYPEIVGGTGRIDTIVAQMTKGRVIAKIGADAVYCLASRELGVGAAFKIEDGSYSAINPMVIGVLKHLNFITDEEHQELLEKFPPILKNHRGDVIGTIETMF